MRRFRFSLRWIFVLLVCAALTANYFRRPTVLELIDLLYETAGASVDFTTDTSGLAPVLARLGGPVPSELLAYIENRIPTETISQGPVWFYDVDSIVFASESAIPAVTVTPYGFFCFAQEGDGSAFAYCVHDSRIYHLGFVNEGQYGPTMTTKLIQDNAWETWPNFRSFLQSQLLVYRD